MSRYRKFIKRAEGKLLDDEPTDDEGAVSTPAKRAKTKAKTKKSPQVIVLMTKSDTEIISSNSASDEDSEDDSELTPPTPEKGGRWRDRSRLSPAGKKAVQASKKVGAKKRAQNVEDEDDDGDGDADDDNDGEEEEEDEEEEEEDEDSRDA
jgi:hypothetical protein